MQNEKFVIEKNIPIPCGRSSNTEVIAKMEIGDSFLTRKPATHFYKPAKLQGYRLTSRLQSDGQLRIWRFE